ncbi:MAG: diphthine--ammonia ligase [Nanoarchaeota archaeon]|nr:diphthine--ammonia ligase [Nanoarchaeota archaeon]
MCGIIGYFNEKDAGKKVVSGLRTIKARGLDYYGITDNSKVEWNKSIGKLKPLPGKNIIGHCLHHIVGIVPQPFDNPKSCFAVNCEIYNWEELNSKHKLGARNDSEMLYFLIDKLGVEKALNEVDGVYAFVYWKGTKVWIARDILGVKPVWFGSGDAFVFCSEKKALEKQGYFNIEELNPRKIIEYDIKSKKLSFIERKFLDLLPEHKEGKSEIIKKLEGLVVNAISKRIPDQKVGILFSGGIDSVVIAWICKQLGIDFMCYTAALDEPGMSDAPDLLWSRKAAKKLGFPLKEVKIPLSEVPSLLKKVVPLIEDTNVVKVGVGLTFFVACSQARKDGIRVIFSGLGSEELFAGYDRHRKTLESSTISRVNEDCLWGLVKIYERDNYRDDVITMNHNIELRIPFLDFDLCKYALKIPAKYKINKEDSKIILRDVAKKMGIPEEFALRKKKAAQYGSKFDRALAKLAKNEGKKKSEYLRQYYPYANLKLGCLFSSGKDSNLAVYVMQQRNYEVSCLITLLSKNQDSYMFHTPAIELARLQAQALGIPLIEQETAGVKEKELVDMENAIKKAKKEYGIQGIVTGALFSNYQRIRIEKICDKLGLKIFAPLWHLRQEDELRELLSKGFKFVMSGIAADGLDKKWLNKEIGEKEFAKLVELNQKIGFNVAGEGGEYESLVLFGPNYSKRIEIVDYDVVEDSPHSARMVVKKALLE